MADRFTTYLFATPTEDGRFRVAFGHILDGGRMIEVVGPAPVLPPDREFTADELAAWQDELVNRDGYTIRYDLRRAFKPAEPFPCVEVIRTDPEPACTPGQLYYSGPPK